MSILHKTTPHLESATWTWNTFFDRSNPTVIISDMTASHYVLLRSHFGTSMPSGDGYHTEATSQATAHIAPHTYFLPLGIPNPIFQPFYARFEADPKACACVMDTSHVMMLTYVQRTVDILL